MAHDPPSLPRIAVEPDDFETAAESPEIDDRAWYRRCRVAIAFSVWIIFAFVWVNAIGLTSLLRHVTPLGRIGIEPVKMAAVATLVGIAVAEWYLGQIRRNNLRLLGRFCVGTIGVILGLTFTRRLITAPADYFVNIFHHPQFWQNLVALMWFHTYAVWLVTPWHRLRADP